MTTTPRPDLTAPIGLDDPATETLPVVERPDPMGVGDMQLQTTNVEAVAPGVTTARAGRSAEPSPGHRTMRRTAAAAIERMPSREAMQGPAMVALAAAPFVMRGISRWRANPKHRKVSSVMTPGAVIVHDHETIAMAASKLAKAEVGAIPVGRDGQLVGMVTDRDIVMQVVSKDLDPELVLVRHLRIDPPVVIRANESVKRAAQLMAREGVRRLPVIDAERVVGVISQADVASALKPEQAGALLQTISSAPVND